MPKKQLLRVGMTKLIRGRKYVLNKAHRWARAKLSGDQRAKLLGKVKALRKDIGIHTKGIHEYYYNPHLTDPQKANLAISMYKKKLHIKSRTAYIKKMEGWFGESFLSTGKRKPRIGKRNPQGNQIFLRQVRGR